MGLNKTISRCLAKFSEFYKKIRLVVSSIIMINFFLFFYFKLGGSSYKELRAIYFFRNRNFNLRNDPCYVFHVSNPSHG